MTKRTNWMKVVLIAGALMCVSAVALARHYGRGWWQKPDSDPIPNLIFNTQTDGGVQSKHGLVNEIVATGYKAISKNSFPLEDNAVNGAVVDGEVRIRAMTLTGDGIQAQLPALIATLKPNYFNSKFWTESTATVTAFIGGVRVTREIPVSVHGSIRESDGTYFLDAEVRGLLKTWVKNEGNHSSSQGYGSRFGFHQVSTTDTLTTFKVVLCGQATQADPPTVEASATDTTCFGGADGTASAVTSGGTAPYTYEWSNGATTANLTDLAAGTYDVTVTDANNQTATAQATVGQGSIVNFTLVSRGISSNGAADGSASAQNPSGGMAPYTYLWSNGATTAAITGLGPGSYTVTVTDADGCTASGTANMFDPPPPG